MKRLLNHVVTAIATVVIVLSLLVLLEKGKPVQNAVALPSSLVYSYSF